MTLEENEAKLCSKCKKNHRQGFQHWCKQCIGEYNKWYRETHKDKIRAAYKRWWNNLQGKMLELYRKRAREAARRRKEADPEGYSERTRLASAKYRKTHVEKLRAYHAAYARAHKKYFSEREHKWYAEHWADPEYKAKRLEQQRAYRLAHKDEINRRNREYYKWHKNEINRKKREAYARRKRELEAAAGEVQTGA